MKTVKLTVQERNAVPKMTGVGEFSKTPLASRCVWGLSFRDFFHGYIEDT